MSKTKEHLDPIKFMSDRHISATYTRYPISLIKGKGKYVWDSEGKRYLDFVTGLAVNNLGHCHPEVVKAIKKQASQLIHVSNLYYTQPQVELARTLTARSFADRVFFCNSGAEANEAAIKLSRKYSLEKYGKDRFEIITMHMSFHGRTMATITATGQEKIQNGFSPLLPGFRYVPFNDLTALKKTINPKTCAVMLEPIQGEGGIRIPDNEYLQEVRKLCDAKALLLILDEIQTGMGRTGKLFAYEHFGVKPDIMTLAKGLAGGVPMGAMVAREDIAASFNPGSHGSTFGGNPLCAAAGVATMKATDRSLLSNCNSVGKYFLRKLNKLSKKYKFIKDVRGLGLMVALELDFPGREMTYSLLEKGYLINCTAENVLRFLPPLLIDKKDIDQITETLDKVFSEVSASKNM